MAYFKNGESEQSAGDVDFDVYFWDNSEDKQTLKEAIEEDIQLATFKNNDSKQKASFTTINGIPCAYYEGVEWSDEDGDGQIDEESEYFKTITYIFPDAAQNRYVEFVFWMGTEEGDADDIAAMNANELVILAENYGLNIKYYKVK